MTACLIGWYHSKFGKLHDKSLEQLIITAARRALEDAGIEAADVDDMFIGHFNSGFSEQDFAASLILSADSDLRFKRSTRVENACATGSAAVHAAVNSIKSRNSKVSLVVGVEKMTHLDSVQAGNNLLHACYVEEESGIKGGFTGVFGQIANSYFQKYGNRSETLAKIAVKNHDNAMGNPLAQMQKTLTLEFCRDVSEKNPLVAGPLRRTDCSLISDGVVAAVIADSDIALTTKKAVAVRGMAQVNDYLPMSRRDMTSLEGAQQAWSKGLDNANLKLSDLDVVETHDCFTLAELMEYEAMGLTKSGEGYKAIEEGWVYKDGKLPINASGGLKAKGHPIGATGVSMHVLQAMQVRGEAGDIQIKDAELAGIFNMGGAGVANYVSILQALR
ncbi:MAG: acetyl-CoA acetyltransferase [Candidatus Marinimicrobia bacterium]|nr:acetyl-CoA acetyltransferase [Candidatus Neomarinimicrobiota bacterium]